MNISEFEKILEQVYGEVAGADGKGFQRHGMGVPLEEQPWVKITNNVGEGFLLGQALKKIFELRTKPDFASWKKEALGAIVYLVFAIMWKEKQKIDSTTGFKNEILLRKSSGDYNDDDGN